MHGVAAPVRPTIGIRMSLQFDPLARLRYSGAGRVNLPEATLTPTVSCRAMGQPKRSPDVRGLQAKR